MESLTGMRVQSKLGVIDGASAKLFIGLGNESVGVCKSWMTLLLARVDGVARVFVGASILGIGALETASRPVDADVPRGLAALPK